MSSVFCPGCRKAWELSVGAMWYIRCSCGTGFQACVYRELPSLERRREPRKRRVRLLNPRYLGADPQELRFAQLEIE